MSAALGIVAAAASISVDSIIVRPKRAIGPFVAQVTLEEIHEDEMDITEHPVEQGATISDHAFKRPARLRIKAMWSNSPSVRGFVDGVVDGLAATATGVQSLVTGNTESSIRDIYAKLLQLQEQAIPFDVFTGKRVYSNMLVRTLTQNTEPQTENALSVQFTLQQVIMVKTQTLSVAAPSVNQASPQQTQPVTNQGTKTLIPTARYDE